ncbi:MAG TPA: MSMEG_3727 family PQQ-associated protein [Thermoanaerobaculia bacterium]|jgi:PQQ system protein|nr:MSMEG_3727 family PQQ-associated protein [Thermoanaerobaculia bacterium]
MRKLSLAFLACAATLLTSCEYVRLLRPSVLKQLNPRVVRLVNELPEVDQPNEELVARLFAHGGLGHAQRDGDGVYRARIRVPAGQYIWEPAIIVMERGGELELDFSNHDPFSYHAALLPNNGSRELLMLPAHKRGTARMRLDGPGYYFFGCPVANHAGRGMLGLIIVSGDAPATAKLDRPKQPRPKRVEAIDPKRTE